jgi:hypothetical protein
MVNPLANEEILMMKRPIYKLSTLAVVFLLSLAVCRPLMAMGGYTADQIGTGLIEKIDYLHHSITVNGQTYTVSSKATFNGVAAFSVLNIGMPIRYMLGNTTTSGAPSGAPASNQAVSQPQVIVSITWLPAGIHAP